MSKANDFLVEIGTEELPPKELPILEHFFARLINSYLADAGIQHGETKTFATPRRIALIIKDLPVQQPDQLIAKSGPSLKAAYDADGNPTKAALGFATSLGVSLDQVSTKDDKLYFEQKVAGSKTIDLLPNMVAQALGKLPVKKSMRWGEAEVSFVRPIHWILMLFGSETVKANIWGIEIGNYTYGHRIHNPAAIVIDKPELYAHKLEQAFVIANYAERQRRIQHQIEEIAKREQATAKIDQSLLEIVTGLVEWPVALLAKFKPEFLRVPKECLISAMQEHQKCFALLDKNGELLPKFVLISNLESIDPATVIRGNELVMHARLADAAFYFDKDQQQSLASRVEQLKTVTYQKKLGSIYDKVQRLQKLSTWLAAKLGAESEATNQAAFLSKADLLTSMVYEFPELQGTMGRYYALHDKQSSAVAFAIEQHYMPRFASDSLPSSTEALCLAIADRIDSLVGMFGIGNIPTGEKDPYGLRRQAIAILRMLIEKQINLDLNDLIAQSLSSYGNLISDATKTQLLVFFNDRLKSWCIEQGFTAKTFAAVAANEISTPLDFDKRMRAVAEFQNLPQAESLAAANKRVQNILVKNPSLSDQVNEALLQEDAEKNLYQAIKTKEAELKPLLSANNYASILKSLSSLQVPVDDFFNKVMVMADDAKLRDNRLNLLQRLRQLFLQVADVSLL